MSNTEIPRKDQEKEEKNEEQIIEEEVKKLNPDLQ